MPTSPLPERLTPLASRLGLRAFYGDVHNHCGLSYGHGRLEDALSRAHRQLDFVSVTGHAHWPDMPLDDPSVAHIVDFHVEGFAKLEKAWPGHFEILGMFEEPGRFTVFPGYEIHSCEHGDYTILYRDMDQRELVKADSPDDLHARLSALYPGRSLAFPHHIGYRRGARGINWDSFREDLSPVLELVSMHGCSETSLGDRPFLHSMGPSDGRSTAQYGLGNGHVFGFLGNTDHHSAYPGSYGHGRSAFYAAENTRDELWNAMLARRTNALTGDCTHLFAAIADHPQGSMIAPHKASRLEIEAVGGSFIDFIDVIRNEQLVARITPEITPRPIERGGGVPGNHPRPRTRMGRTRPAFRLVGIAAGRGGRNPRDRAAGFAAPRSSRRWKARTRRRLKPCLKRTGARIRFRVRAQREPEQRDAGDTGLRRASSPHAGRLVRSRIQRATLRGERRAGFFRARFAGNLGPIDSPAFRFHPLPRPRQWQWRGQVDLARPLRQATASMCACAS